MPVLPPVADPTASLPPRSAGVLPASAVVPSIISSAAPAPPRAPVVSTGNGRSATGARTQAPTTTSSVKSSSKSKKKAVTMATAATASSGGQGGSSGENTGRWTAEEHNLFLQGLELHGKGWKKIAGLIKSRTVVQIRTHAQKYFQKLAKAKQNGEDVTMAGGGSSNGGAVAGSAMMMGDGGRSSLNGGAVPNAAGSTLSTSSVAGGGHVSSHTNKRRKQTSGTKRKAIQSVVASARRQGKKKVAASSTKNGTTPARTLNPIIDSVAPALAPYVLPTPLSSMGGQQTATAVSNTIGQSASGGTVLEDSLFRFLTPAPILPPETQVNPVAWQAGANPITLPTDQPGLSNTLAGGEVSPTGVNDLDLYPTWTDYSKDTPSWYSKGSDVDALLDVADTLDWLADTGDLTETYEEADQIHASTSVDPSQSSDFHFAEAQPSKGVAPTSGGNFYSNPNNNTTLSMNTLPRIDSGAGVNVPPLPSLFDGTTDNGDDPSGSKSKLSLHMSTVPSVTNLDEHLFSSPIEEHDFVSTILDETGAGSSDTLAALGATP